MPSYLDNGSGAISYTLDLDHNFELLELRLHLSDEGTIVENFEVNVDSGISSEHDLKWFSQPMELVRDMIWVPENKRTFGREDNLIFSYANTGGKTYGIEIVYVYREIK